MSEHIQGKRTLYSSNSIDGETIISLDTGDIQYDNYTQRETSTSAPCNRRPSGFLNETCTCDVYIPPPSYNRNSEKYIKKNLDKVPSNDTLFGYNCVQNWVVYSGNMNGEETCQLGEYGTGNVIDVKILEGRVNSNPTIGNVKCSYSYNLSQFVQNQRQIIKFQRWLRSIVESLYELNNPKIAYHMLSVNIIRILTKEFFQSIFRTISYETNPDNPFDNFDYISNPIEDYVKQVETNIAQGVKDLWSFSRMSHDIPEKLHDSIIQLFQLPYISKENNDYYVYMNVSNEILITLLPGTSNFSTETSKLLSRLLQDSTTLITNQQTNNRIIPSNPLLENTSIVIYTYISISEWTIHDKVSLVSDSDLMLVSIMLRSEISRWSPMLMILALSVNGGYNTFSDDYSKFTIDTGMQLFSKYKKKCLEGAMDKECTEIIREQCRFSYQPPSGIDIKKVSGYLLTSSSEDCQCFVSNLPLPTLPKYNNPTAMCFSNKCSLEIRNKFNLSDGLCSDYCDTMRYWNENDPQNSQFDKQRFEQICGESTETMNRKFSFSILSGLLALFSMIILSWSKLEGISLQVKIVIGIILSILFIGISIFLAYDGAGISFCRNDDLYCQSRFTKIKLADEFCPDKLCQCSKDGECKSDCLCIDNLCVSKDGHKGEKYKDRARPNFTLILFIGVVFVCIVSIYITMIYDRKNPIGLIDYITYATILALLSVFLYFEFKPQPGLQKSSCV